MEVTMNPWMIWVGIGVICMIIEVFTPGFLFLSFGIGAVLTGVVSLLIPGLAAQIGVYAVVTILLFINLRKLSKKLESKNSVPTNVFALKGKTGVVLKDVGVNERGYVKIGGEEWSALTHQKEHLAAGTLVTVIDVDGNKVIVVKTESSEEE